MKLIGFWLLVLLAVLVPATASIATSMICPPAATAKAQFRGQAVQTERFAQHTVASGPHARLAKPKNSAKKPAAEDQQAENCCDATPCSHCAGCGSCASMAATVDSAARSLAFAKSTLPEPGGPRAEFLLSGQDRPPRAS